jgi:hypothetical protein
MPKVRISSHQAIDRCVNCRLPCDVCDTCARKSQQPRVRTAVDRIVEEHEIPVADNVGDLHVFMDENEDVVLRTLEDAVNRHM